MRSSRKCSKRIPDWPDALPLGAALRLARKSFLSRRRGCVGSKSRMCCGSGTRGAGGRLAGSRSSAKVSAFPGASASPTSRCLPRDISPCLMLAHAAKIRISFSSAAERGRRCAHTADAEASSANCCQAPSSKRRNRRSSSAFPSAPFAAQRRRSMRGQSMNSFQALS